MKNNWELMRQYDAYINWIKKQILYSDVMPSQKWYSGCKNRNDEICRDWEFEGIYSWMKVDKEKAAIEYSEMVNEFRKRIGFIKLK